MDRELHPAEAQKKRTLTRTRLLLTAVAMVSLLWAADRSVANPTAAFASNCTGELPPNGHHFDGTAIPRWNSWGALSRLVVGQAALCSNPLKDEVNHISAWSMMQSSTNTCYLAQSGYRRTINVDYWLEFEEYEYSGCNGYFERSFGGNLDLGYSFNASVYYDDTTNAEVMSTSDGYQTSTNYDPYGTWGSYWKPEWEGEVLDSKDEMPGTSTSPGYFAGLNVQTSKQSVDWTHPTSFSLEADQGCFNKQDSDDFYIYHC